MDIGIITAPREANYFTGTIDSIRRTFPTVTPHVFAEPGSQTFSYQEIILHQNEKKLGCFDNWMAAARYLSTFSREERIIICEDDIVFDYPALEEIVEPDVPVFSYYTARVNGVDGLMDRWLPANVKQFGWCGNLAINFDREFLKRIVNHKLMTNRELINGKPSPHLDSILGYTVNELKEKIHVHQPTLVRHTGRKSTLLACADAFYYYKTRSPYERYNSPI